MKLLERYSRLNITATILTFIIGSCTFYFLLNYIIIDQLDEALQTEQQEIVTYVRTHNALPEIIPTEDQYIRYDTAITGNAIPPAEFHTIETRHGDEAGQYREIRFKVNISGHSYIVYVDKPMEEAEDLLRVIIGVTIAMIGIILLIGFLINRIVIRRLWKPFYATIDKVKTYNLSDQGVLGLDKTDIDEFSLLNKSISEMMQRIQQDYGSLKSFTGQAAHEMQTPLAIIRSKLDALVQHEEVLRHNAQTIVDIERSVQRLSRLHQSLLLLTKVENRQFELNERVEIDKIIADKCAEYTEMAETMGITISQALTPTNVLFHNHLADILVNNLVNNALKYNRPGGTIDIAIQDETLTITNTSISGQLDSGMVFKPFYRNGASGEGTGLGLSIARQVCDAAGYVMKYEYLEGRHRFTIIFNSR